VVGRSRAALDERRADLMRAALIALMLTSTLAALVSSALARVVVRPLHSLRVAVANVTERDPGAAEFGPSAGIAEIDALRVALRETFARLAISLAQAERFARAAAHELRTPLTAMLGELELIAEHTQAADRGDLLRVHAIGRRLSMLVDRLLVLAQLEPSQATQRIDLVDVLETALETLSKVERARVQLTLPDQPVFVLGDDTLLGSMIGNALDNALKFSPREVRCQLTANSEHALMVVSDDGPGIVAEERERVFRPFYRSASGGVHGHGIGLALVAHVAALHHGSARFADSTRGARLELRLPREPDRSGGTAPASPAG